MIHYNTHFVKYIFTKTIAYTYYIRTILYK